MTKFFKFNTVIRGVARLFGARGHPSILRPLYYTHTLYSKNINTNNK